MSTDYKALCAELADALNGHTSLYEGHEFELVARARAALAQPEPEGLPTDEDQPMPAAVRDMPEQQQRWYALGWRAAITRYARPTIKPVPDTKAHELLNLLLDDLDALVDNSEGVAGLHPNGDVASWESLREGGRFETWLMRMGEARAFLDSTMDKPDDIATTIKPVPVAERRPEVGDWVWHCYAGVRFWEHGIYNGRQFFIGDGPESQPATHWCSSHALPVPGAEAP
jgi:hypothetical protein